MASVVRLLLLVLLAGCARSATSRHEPPSNRRPATTSVPASSDDVRSSMVMGNRLFAEHNYAEARVAFEQAYRLGHQPAALLGVAECWRSQKRAPAAYESFEHLLSEHEGQLTAEERRVAVEAIEELGEVTGALTVDVSEPDAELELDGKSWGRTPMTKPRRVRAAPHTLRVAKPGYSTVEERLVVGPKETKKINVKLDVDKAAGTQQLSEAERKASARAAFAEGIQLQERGDCALALGRFETAERLYDAPTHLLHLAQCQGSLGKLVEAQESYATLGHLVLPPQAPDAFREAQESGRAELSKLKTRLPTLRLDTIPPASALKNLVVQINGSQIPSDLVGIVRPVNPGKYHVTVSAGARSGAADAELKEGEAKVLEVRLR